MSFVLFEFWFFGFFATLFTNTWSQGPAIVHLVEYAIVTYPVHATMATTVAGFNDLLFKLTQLHAVAVWAGVMVALALIYATDVPRLVELRLLYNEPVRSARMGGLVRTDALASIDRQFAKRAPPLDVPPTPPRPDGVRRQLFTDAVGDEVAADYGLPWHARFYAWPFFGAILSMALIVQGVMFASMLYVDAGRLNSDQSRLLAALFIGSGVLLLGTFVTATLYGGADVIDGYVNSGRTNLKYILFFVLVAHTPAYNDFATSLGIWGRYFLTMAVALVIYAAIVFFGRYDRLLGSEPAYRIMWTYALVFLVHASVYLGSPLAMTFNDTNEFALAYAVALSLLWTGAFLIYGSLQGRRARLRDQDYSTDAFLFREEVAAAAAAAVGVDGSAQSRVV